MVHAEQCLDDQCRRTRVMYKTISCCGTVFVALLQSVADIVVQLTEKNVNIRLRRQFANRRRYWTELDTVSNQRKEATPAVDVSQCSWCLEDATVINGECVKTLSVSFGRPMPSSNARAAFTETTRHRNSRVVIYTACIFSQMTKMRVG